jgi:hypothetical protein
MYDPEVVDAFFSMQGEEAAHAPAALPTPVEGGSASVRPPERDAVEISSEELDLQAFFELGRALNRPLSAGQVGQILWAHFRHRFPASAFVLHGYESASDTIVAVYAAGEGAERLGTTPVAVGDRLSGWVAATGRTVMNSDARLDLDEPERDGSALRSALAVAVMSNGRPAAVLSLYAEAVNAFDEGHRRVAEAAGRALAGCGVDFSPQTQASSVCDVSRIGTHVSRN